MTEKRKKLQDKLRRKYKYHTNDDYGRGTILIKPEAGMDCAYVHINGEFSYQDSYDLAVSMPKRVYGDSPITFYTTGYRDLGEDKPEDNRWEKRGEHHICMPLEELDMIHAIAHEMADEYGWNEQNKKSKLRRKA